MAIRVFAVQACHITHTVNITFFQTVDKPNDILEIRSLERTLDTPCERIQRVVRVMYSTSIHAAKHPLGQATKGVGLRACLFTSSISAASFVLSRQKKSQKNHDKSGIRTHAVSYYGP